MIKSYKGIPNIIKDNLKESGISFYTFKKRVNHFGWDMFRAGTKELIQVNITKKPKTADLEIDPYYQNLYKQLFKEW